MITLRSLSDVLDGDGKSFHIFDTTAEHIDEYEASQDPTAFPTINVPALVGDLQVSSDHVLPRKAEIPSPPAKVLLKTDVDPSVDAKVKVQPLPTHDNANSTLTHPLIRAVSSNITENIVSSVDPQRDIAPALANAKHSKLPSKDNSLTDGFSKEASLNSCPSIASKIFDEPEIKSSPGDEKWCFTKMNEYKVQIGKTWGRTPRSAQLEWDSKMCNDIILNNGKCSVWYMYILFTRYLPIS